MDLSKAYDCLPDDLLIVQLAACGLDITSLRLMYSYLNSRYQRLKIGSHRCTVKKITIEVPQGSELCLLLFNIFINDVWVINLDSGMCNFADDNTFCCCCCLLYFE